MFHYARLKKEIIFYLHLSNDSAYFLHSYAIEICKQRKYDISVPQTLILKNNLLLIKVMQLIIHVYSFQEYHFISNALFLTLNSRCLNLILQTTETVISSNLVKSNAFMLDI